MKTVQTRSAPKRNFEQGDGNSKQTKASSSSKRTKTNKHGADAIGLTYEAFEKTAPELSMKLYETKTDEKDSTETSTANLLDLNLKKTVNSTGSFGYNLSGRHIMVDVEVDGKKESVAALVTVNITVVGSKKLKARDADSDSD